MSRAKVRMFAGPNGSGKTTVKNQIVAGQAPGFLGVYVNPDDIEAQARRDGRLSLEPYRVTLDDAELREAFTSSTFLQQNGLAEAAAVVRCDGKEIDFGGLAMNSYYASVLSDFLRRKLLDARVSFSFETVMSEPGKVGLLKEARSLGFRTYLYFVSTEDPEINVARVGTRVSQGGHGVPEDKILSRYHRSLALSSEAVRNTNRAYFFDTTDSESLFVAEVTEGSEVELHCDNVPKWFRANVWDKL